MFPRAGLLTLMYLKRVLFFFFFTASSLKTIVHNYVLYMKWELYVFKSACKSITWAESAAHRVYDMANGGAIRLSNPWWHPGLLGGNMYHVRINFTLC